MNYQELMNATSKIELEMWPVCATEWKSNNRMKREVQPFKLKWNKLTTKFKNTHAHTHTFYFCMDGNPAS